MGLVELKTASETLSKTALEAYDFSIIDRGDTELRANTQLKAPDHDLCFTRSLIHKAGQTCLQVSSTAVLGSYMVTELTRNLDSKSSMHAPAVRAATNKACSYYAHMMTCFRRGTS